LYQAESDYQPEWRKRVPAQRLALAADRFAHEAAAERQGVRRLYVSDSQSFCAILLLSFILAYALMCRGTKGY
jgi:hypothetical protein